MFRSQPASRLRQASILAFLGTLLFLAPACGDDDPTGPRHGDSAGVGPYLSGLPTWSDFSPLEQPQDEIAGEGRHYTDNVDETIYDCVETPYSLTENPEKIVTLDPDANVLWLGALLQGKGYKDGIGSLAELPIRERSPLRISVDLLTEDNMRVVEHPSLATVNQAIGDIVSSATDAGNRAGSSVSFSQERMHTVNQAALKLGASAGYMSVSVKASLSASRTAAEKTVSAYFVQKMFTASVELPEGPTDFFSPEFTNEVLEEHRAAGRIGSDNLPVFVSSITYGRILMFSFTSSSNVTDIRAALSASFSSLAGAEIEARYLDILNQAKISVVTIGGEGKNATALIQNGQLRDYFTEESALTSARPISYTVRNLGDNSIAKVSETTDYNITECTARPQTGEMTIDVSPNSASITIDGPSGYHKDLQGDQILRLLEPGGYSILVSKPGDPDYENIEESQEVEVVAGQITDVVAVLEPEPTPGGQFEVKLVRVVPTELDCTWEGEAELFYTLYLNGSEVISLPEGSAIPKSEGQSLIFPANTTLLDICAGEKLTISGWVADADGIGNGPDRVANFNSAYIYHDIPKGDGLSILGQASSCKARLYFNVQRVQDLQCKSAAPQTSFLVSRRPMPLIIEEWSPVEPEWQTVQLSY